MGQAVEIVRHYSLEIHNGRTLMSAFKHLVSEVKELRTELRNGNAGVDGIKGEVMDVVNCALDILFQAHPEISFDEIDGLMEAKCRKWMLKYSNDKTADDIAKADAASEAIAGLVKGGVDIDHVAAMTGIENNSVRCAANGSLVSKRTRERLETIYPLLSSSFPAKGGICGDYDRYSAISSNWDKPGPDGRMLADLLSGPIVDLNAVREHIGYMKSGSSGKKRT